jgi:hypothetical protein
MMTIKYGLQFFFFELTDNDGQNYFGRHSNGCFLKFGVEVGVEGSIVNALYRLRITDQLFKSTLLHEWCDLNRLSNAYFDARFKKTAFTFIKSKLQPTILNDNVNQFKVGLESDKGYFTLKVKTVSHLHGPLTPVLFKPVLLTPVLIDV